MKYKTVELALIEEAIANQLKPFGLDQQSIQDMQYGLTEASLRGIDTHGLRLFDCYLKELAGGRSNAKADFSLTQTMPCAATLDANGGLGIVAGMRGMRQAISMAKESGVAAVAVKNSNHYGAASVYTLYAAKQGMIGLSFSNADALIAPFNGIEAMLGTNPISMAAPASNGETFCLDMACSQVAYSKIKHCLAQGEPIDPSWMHPSDDKTQAGSLKGLGGYKGVGLAMMVQIMTAVLTGSMLDHQMSHLYQPPYDKPRAVSHFMIAINIQAFIELPVFQSTLSTLLSAIRHSTPANSQDKIMVPGDLEQQRYQMRKANGIPLSQSEYESLFG